MFHGMSSARNPEDDMLDGIRGAFRVTTGSGVLRGKG
jgi:hypothetical protein